ncbi:MAG: hypothetical protein LBS11_08065 [Oscillospiraceae bacterium]|nr:hypothetical protein [Oscillospiraceae bacterium]
MIKRITVSRGGWLSLALLLTLAVFALTLRVAVSRVYETIYDNLFEQTRITADLLCDHIDDYVNQDGDWETYDYAGDFGRSFSRLDSWTGVFAAIYDKDRNALSERVSGGGEPLVSPWESEAFIQAVSGGWSGEVTIPTVLLNGKADEMRVYFRWVPTGEYATKLLTATGVNRDAIKANHADMLVAWCVALLATAAVTVTAALIILTHHRHEEGIPDAER